MFHQTMVTCIQNYTSKGNIKMCTKFIDFYTKPQKSSYFFYKGCFYESDSLKPISNIWINIKDVDFYNFNANTFYFTLDYKIKNKKYGYDTLNAVVSYKSGKKPRITYTPSINNIVTSLKQCGSIQNPRLFSSLLKLYIEEILLKECSALSNHVFDIGWSSSKDYRLYFMPLESDYSSLTPPKNPLFYDIDKHVSLVPYFSSQKIKYDDGYTSVIRFLYSNKNILSIFAYTLHAILFHALVSYDSYQENTLFVKQSSIFSICIYGSDIEKSTAAANIFSNLLSFSSSQPEMIPKTSCFSITSLHAKAHINKLCLFSSIPFCITAKNYRITRSTALLKRMHQLRLHNRLHIYPVFISTNPINADEILDFSSDSFTLPANSADYKIKLDRLLYDYILFLKDILNNTEPVEDKLDLSHQLNRFYFRSGILDNDTLLHEKESLTQRYNRFLYYALASFCSFLKKSDISSDVIYGLSYYAEKYLLSQESTEESAVSEIPTDRIILKSLHTWLKQEASVDSGIARIAFEKRDSREQCYYLESKSWYASYSKYSKQNKLAVYPKKRIMNALKETSLLNMRNESGSLGKYRTFDGKKAYYYILPFSLFSQKCNS